MTGNETHSIRDDIPAAIAATVTLILMFVASFVPVNAMWGFNHFHFAGEQWLYALVFAAMCVLYLLLGPFPQSLARRLFEVVAELLWEKGPIPKVLMAAAATYLFYRFRLQLFFIGDGYHLLTTFGGLGHYSTEITKAGSVLVVRGVQSLLGASTYETARSAFQLVSVVCGGMALYAILVLSAVLASGKLERLWCLTTLLCSGTILIFFGHVEFYPMVWLAGLMFILASLKFLRGEAGLGQAVLYLAIAIVLHLEAVCLIPSLVYLVWYRMASSSGTKISARVLKWGLLSIPLAALLAGAILPHIWPGTANFLLSVVASNSSFSSYPIVSWQHLVEVGNLVLVVSPGFLILLVLMTRRASGPETDIKGDYLLTAASGTLSFVLVVEPMLGMARDYDLMSLMILPAVLWCLHRLLSTRGRVAVRTFVIYALTSVVIATAFTYSFLSEEPAEKKIHSILQVYGARDYGGWVSLTGYYRVKGDDGRATRLQAEMNRLFPDRARMKQVDSLVRHGSTDEAMEIAVALVAENPDNGAFHRTLGDVYKARGEIDKALNCYYQAVKYRPDYLSYWALGTASLQVGQTGQAVTALSRAHELVPMDDRIIEHLASALLHAGEVSRASNLADTLFSIDPVSPGGHVIKMLVAVGKGDAAGARSHYQSFLQVGIGRSDYDEIRMSYEYLADH